MVYAGKELADIAFQYIAILPGIFLISSDGLMRAFAPAIGIAVVDKAAIECRLYNIAKGVMYHAVAKRRSANEALFGIKNGESVVRPGTIDFRLQFFLQHQ